MSTNIQQLASALDVLRRMDSAESKARRDLNPGHWDAVKWAWEDLRDAIMRGAPSGSGIDCGTTLAEQVCSATRIELYCEFHHMDQHGYYDGWTRHPITITPAFDGISMKVGGRDRNGIKEYLAEVYYDWARSECPHVFTMPAPVAA